MPDTVTVTIPMVVDAEEFWANVCGSAGESWSWWREYTFTEGAWDKPGVLFVGIEDPMNEERTVYASLTVQALADAYAALLARGYQFKWDDLDAVGSDCILQQAVLGDVVYG